MAGSSRGVLVDSCPFLAGVPKSKIVGIVVITVIVAVHAIIVMIINIWLEMCICAVSTPILGRGRELGQVVVRNNALPAAAVG